MTKCPRCDVVFYAGHPLFYGNALCNYCKVRDEALAALAKMYEKCLIQDHEEFRIRKEKVLSALDEVESFCSDMDMLSCYMSDKGLRHQLAQLRKMIEAREAPKQEG